MTGTGALVGFKKADGIFREIVDETHILLEYGFEIKIPERCELQA